MKRETSLKHRWYHKARLQKHGLELKTIVAKTRRPETSWTIVEETVESAYSEELLEDLVSIIKENK